MKVTDIDIRDLRWDDRTKCFRAAVSMAMLPAGGTRPKHVNFICQSHRANDCPSSLITYDLVTHALDQARAMPGFRRGEEQISVDITTAVGRIPFMSRAATG
ncbi:MAG: hypothetical protein VX874_12790 [Pseudomonadota bacterium]|nr:hypothetical protein [Pseudomonadota bacterium]